MTFPPLRAWLLVVVTTLTLLTLSYLIFDRWGLFLGLLLALFWNYAMLLHQHENAVEYFHGRKVEGQDPWLLNETLHLYIEKFRSPPIKLYLCTHPQPLFLASTSNWHQPYLLFSEALLQTLTPQEQQALLGLGVSTIKYRHTFFKYTLDRIALSWMSLGSILDHLLLPLKNFNFARRLHYLIGWVHLKLAYPQSLQAKADLEAFQALSNQRALATALWKIHGMMDVQPTKIPEIFLHQSLLGFPQSRRSAFQFILPIELRLRFLVGYFPI